MSLSFFGTKTHPEFTATATYPDGSQLDATGFAAWTADPSTILKFGVWTTPTRAESPLFSGGWQDHSYR